MVDVSTLKSLKTMAEAVNDVITTEEVVADLEVTEIQVVNEEVQVVAVSVQEKKVVDSEAIEIVLLEPNVQTDQEEKVVLVAMQLQKENQVPFKEKKERLEDLVALVIDQREDLLMMPKQEDLEKAKTFLILK
jgi:hypothetical protein